MGEGRAGLSETYSDAMVGHSRFICGWAKLVFYCKRRRLPFWCICVWFVNWTRRSIFPGYNVKFLCKIYKGWQGINFASGKTKSYAIGKHEATVWRILINFIVLIKHILNLHCELFTELNWKLTWKKFKGIHETVQHGVKKIGKEVK